MTGSDYRNKNGGRIYVMHFPGTGKSEFENFIEEQKNKTFAIHNDLSIISIMNSSCWENSPIRVQCELSGIQILNTAFAENEWNNTLKIKHILRCLDDVPTKYALIVDGRDVVVTADLDEAFIDRFIQFGKPVIYNGTPTAYPKEAVEPLDELLSIRSKQKFLNAGVCVGEAESLKRFYTLAGEILKTLPDNKSEQLIIRMARQKMKNTVGIDHDNEIFRIYHSYDTVFRENEDGSVTII